MSLTERIIQIIEVHGPISVAQFMNIALHDPAHGYYARRDPIGTGGDFTTAPEINQMFGELLGAWIVQVWREQGAPSPARLVELGPGHGTLMADVLRTAKLDPKFLSSIEITLVETSPGLQKTQAEKLEGAPAVVQWTERFDDSLADRPLFVLANEFFDALPIRQFVQTERGWCERMVGLDQQRNLAFALAPLSRKLNIPGRSRSGDIYEVSPTGESIVEQIAAAVAQRGGAMLIVDYGYGTNSGFGETLQAIAGHKFASALQNPGEADLSSHVDFAALTRAAERASAKTYGPVAQGALLKALGISQRAGRLARHNAEHADSIAAAVKRLTSPEQMGTLFKALAILPKGATCPPGF